MKILLINDTAVPIGGAESTTHALRDGLRARGHDARVFATSALCDQHSSFADYTCFGTVSHLRTLNRVINVSAVLKLRRVLNEFVPDVVHVRMFLTQLSPLILPLLQNVPSLYHATWYETICPTGEKLLPHGAICQDMAGAACRRNGCLSLKAWPLLMAQLKLLQRWRNVFDVIVANSTYVRQLLVENDSGPVEVVWNGVPVQPARIPLSLPPTVSYAGRLTQSKGVDILLRAFVPVVREHPAARLLIAGDGPERTRLETLVDQLDLTGNVSMLGHLSQRALGRQLSSTWVRVLPSRWAEPFGVAAAEAMMRGTAVVASRSGGLTDIVQDHKTGFLVTPNDPAAFAEALVTLLSNRELAEEMGTAARTAALEKFSVNTMATQFEQLYQRMCHDNGGTGGN